MKWTVLIFAAVVLYLAQVATLCSFWRWYVMPIFPVRSLTFTQAMGLLLILAVARPQQPRQTDEDYTEKAIGFAVGVLCVVWATAGVIRIFS